MPPVPGLPCLGMAAQPRSSGEPRTAITPAGLRAGDRATAEALCARRGAAVLAYCERVVTPGAALDAAAEGFARFRAAVIATPDSADVDPDVLLLSATRHAAAVHAPRPALARVAEQLGAGRRGPQACALVPELLAARAEELLSDADRLRLSRHLQRCRACEALQRRFSAAEAAYRNPPDASPDGPATAAIVAALTATAAPHTVAGAASGGGSHVVTAGTNAPAAECATTAGGSLSPPDDAGAGADDAGPEDALEADDAGTDADGDPTASEPWRAVGGDPAQADRGAGWPDGAGVVTASRSSGRAGPAVAAVEESPPLGASPAPAAVGEKRGPRRTAVIIDDTVGAEIADFRSALGEDASGAPFDDALETEDVLPVRRRRPPAPARRGPRRGEETDLDEPPGRERAVGAVHPLSTSERRRPLWALALPFIVVIAAIVAAMAFAGVLRGSSGHAHRAGAGAATLPATPAAPAAATARHRARHHRRHHHHALAPGAGAPTAAASATAPARTPTTTGGAGGSSAAGAPAPASSGGSAPTRPAGSSTAPAPSHPAPASTAPSPPATPPATSIQSNGSASSAAPPAGGAPASSAPSGYQPSGG